MNGIGFAAIVLGMVLLGFYAVWDLTWERTDDIDGDEPGEG